MTGVYTAYNRVHVINGSDAWSVTGVNAVTSTIRLLKWYEPTKSDLEYVSVRSAEKPYDGSKYGVKVTNGGLLPIKHTFTADGLIRCIMDEIDKSPQKADIAPFPVGTLHVTIFAGFPCIYDDLSTYRYYIGSKKHRLMKSKVNARTTVDEVNLSNYGRALIPLSAVMQRLQSNIDIFNDPLAVTNDGKKTVITI